MNYKDSRECCNTTANTTMFLLIAMGMLIISVSSYATIDKIQMVYADILSSDNKINNDYQTVNILFTDRSRNIESDCSDGLDNDNDGLIDQEDTDDCPE